MRNIFKRSRSKRTVERRRPSERVRQDEVIRAAASRVQGIRDLTSLLEKQSARLKACAKEQRDAHEALCATLERIGHTLKTGKTLRN